MHNEDWETRLIIQNESGKKIITFQIRCTVSNKNTSIKVWNDYGDAYWEIKSGKASSGKQTFMFSWDNESDNWITIGIWIPREEIDVKDIYAYCYTGIHPLNRSSLEAKIGD